MKVLLDHNLPRRFRQVLQGHQFRTTREMRWETLRNGALLAQAADAEFGAFISADKKLEFERNLKMLPLPLVVLDALTNSYEGVRDFAPFVQQLLTTRLQNRLYVIESTGNVVDLTEPRRTS
ncbi:MAG: hypothetical protein ABSB42_04845 [Tepidisphaeraceae bacterium]